MNEKIDNSSKNSRFSRISESPSIYFNYIEYNNVLLLYTRKLRSVIRNYIVEILSYIKLILI